MIRVSGVIGAGAVPSPSPWSIVFEQTGISVDEIPLLRWYNAGVITNSTGDGGKEQRGGSPEIGPQRFLPLPFGITRWIIVGRG